MLIQTYTNSETFQTLSAEWHDLLQRASINHIFMTPEFLESWWQTLGEGELQIITFRDEIGKLIGIAPLYQFTNAEKKLQLSFIGCVNVSDYLDFIVDKNHVDAIYGEVTKLLQNHSATQFFFCSIPQNSPTLTLLSTSLNSLQMTVSQTQQDVCPILQLPNTWDEYLASIGKKQRHEIKRKAEKLFAETSATFEEVDTAENIEPAIDDFIHLHQASSVNKKSFWDEKHIQFFHAFVKRAAEQKWLRLSFLKIDGQRVAAMLGFSYANSFFLYNSGFNAEQYKQYGVGSVLTAHTIQQTIERHEQRYDFLRGDEEYKFRFRAVAEPIFDLTISK